MPEYLAPGVYIEETSFRPKTIEGVSTSTAGFVGPARFGPIEGVPELLTSFTDFERIYGGIDNLKFSDGEMPNYLAHAVRAYFENGGKRLYVSRIYSPKDPKNAKDGCAINQIKNAKDVINLEARYPGECGNMVVNFLFKTSQNILSVTDNNGKVVLKGAAEYDLIILREKNQDTGTLYWLQFDNTKNTFRLRQTDPEDTKEKEKLLKKDDDVRIITVDVTIELPGKFSNPLTFENLSFHPTHKRALGKIFAKYPKDRSTELFIPLIIFTEIKNGVSLANVILSKENISNNKDTLSNLTNDKSKGSDKTIRIVLGEGKDDKKGNDGEKPSADFYRGSEELPGSEKSSLKKGLNAFEDIEDISIVAAPGSSKGYSTDQANVQTILNHLITHCEKMHYRIAILDSADGQCLSEVRKYRGQLDSKYAALYYPWIKILDPLTNEIVNLPPSGFVAGIYARNDVEYGVHKAPANEVVKLAVGFDVMVNKPQQEVANPEGINCFRFFEGRGYRLWGARTVTSDPEWKYVNLRRYFAFLERSIDKGTQWVVFENNSERLWANVKSTVEDFLFNEWKSGHLMGESTKEAYFVKCDRSTMTQSDLDNGRLICLIGVAPVRPAEFVIFRIGQKLLDTKT